MEWYSKITDLYAQIPLVKINEQLLILDEKIHLHRDIWESRKLQVLSRLDSIFNINTDNIYARNTEVISISKPEAKQFLDTNHLMGFGGGKTFIGLRDDTELVAVAAFSKILLMKYEQPPYNSVELERYCSLQGTTVVGGLDKLIKAYLNENNVDDIITYVDKEWSDGSSYLNLGFKAIGETEPLTFMVDPLKWRRKLYKGSLEKGSYLVKNQGNIKMRLVV